MSPKKHRNASHSSPKAQCSTLLEDEITRCSEIPTHGRPVERCRVHHEQYCTMTKRYKEAQKFVDETFAGALIPTTAEILEYTSVPEILEKARLMKKYVNAIRQERTGRDIHHNRFFLKVDDGHKIRIKVLAKQMTEGVEIRDALEARAMLLHLKDHPAKDWAEQFQTGPIGEDDDVDPGSDTYSYQSYVRSRQRKARPQAASRAEDDLIDLQLRFEREKIFYVFEMILDPEAFQKSTLIKAGQTPSDEPEERNARNLTTNVLLQYTRRIIFHHPQLFAKSLDKVSFKDFIMDDDFDYEDILRMAELYVKRLKIGLRWWKDSWTEAIAIKDSTQASANMGSVESRIKILGGWIYNNSRDIPAPNKVWHGMFTSDIPEKDTENRFVRLCCNFDELHTFLEFSALILSYNTPSFCSSKVEGDPRDSTVTRNHLSLCGVILADLVNGAEELKYSGPLPSVLPAKKPGCITWVELQVRAYMFGAIRNEPDDFTTAFLRELRARPDIFSVVTRSDTDPPLKVESFGDVTDQARTRQFEAPFQPVENAPAGRGTWNVMRTAFNVLYGGGQGPYANMAGYLSSGYNPVLLRCGVEKLESMDGPGTPCKRSARRGGSSV
ncbi:hypothetical protein B0H16DRAFT_1609539 [Mycena metata]|uniref:Uncharacterized protein n=1 Tax=Mycena metata TaxID=1033252 RepID=A0AAD7HDI8_9AGAR|nr:hypothetical protein B0H16DRAFT_1609539 [Mycena metata]